MTGTNPLAIAIPSSDGRPIVADVSMGAVTHGDVLAGRAQPEELVPFGGAQAHKSFALAVGLQLLVDALDPGDGYGAVLLVARPEADPVPAFRELAGGVRLPGDRRVWPQASLRRGKPCSPRIAAKSRSRRACSAHFGSSATARCRCSSAST